jgi:cytidylate kinase
MNAQANRDLIITIDGPAGAGKSAVAHLLSEYLNLQFLDTGSMYRAVAATVIDRHVDPEDPESVTATARSLKINFDWDTTPPRLQIDGSDASVRIRDKDVTALTPRIASIGPVREVLVEAQRAIGREHPRLVTEGRDQGSVVFTDATHKFYLDASPTTRAKRRAAQLREQGHKADETELEALIIERDHQDMTRSDSPLTCPSDAVRVDTSEMTLQEVVRHLADTVNSATPGG